MSTPPRRPNTRFQDRFPIPVDVASHAATFTQKIHPCEFGGVLELVMYDNVTGLASDAANYFDIEIKNGAVSMAKWSTLTGAQGTLAADTYVAVPLSANVSFNAGDVLSLVLTLHGTQTLPAGRLVAHARYF
jgi:hypothetical protein